MQLSQENAKASLKSYSLSVLMLTAYMSVLQSRIKIVASNHYADKERLSSICQFSQYSSRICWALWFHRVSFISSALSETLSSVQNTTALKKAASQEQKQNVSQYDTFSFIFNLLFFVCFHCSHKLNYELFPVHFVDTEKHLSVKVSLILAFHIRSRLLAHNYISLSHPYEHSNI